jgi:hypothetical protein
MYWAASAWVATEKSFRRIQGYQELWALKSVLDEDLSSGDIIHN